MSAYTDTERFLQAVFGSDFGTRAIFANLHPAVHTRELHQLDTGRDCYWSVAAFDPGHTERTLARAVEVRALVIDDVGTKVPALAVEMALGLPTAVVETSQGNFQWVYRLPKPVAIDDWHWFFAEVEARIGQQLEGKDAVHLFRLPLGVNTKPGRDGFAVRLTELNSGIELSGVVFNTGIKTTKSLPSPEPSSGGAEIKLDLAELREFMGWIRNDIKDRHVWVTIVGHGLKALCKDPEDGFTVFDEWSDPEKTPGYNREKWLSFGAGGLQSKAGHLKGMAQAANPEGFAKMFAPKVFDDGVSPEITPGSKRKGITFTPYKWTDPDKLPLRDWLYGKILIRKFISMTVAPGGVGKSSLTAVETLAQITGRNLLGEQPTGKLRVALWNLEDPHEETKKKIQAAALHYGITEADIGDRLFVDSGRDQPLVIAVMERNAPTIRRPMVNDVVEQIRLNRIDVVVVDPFVSCHEVPENDNTAQDMVVKEWGRVAELGNCAVHLIDHTRKSAPGVEVTTESSRGGKAKTDAARVVRVINRMTETEGKAAGVVNEWSYFRTYNDKANMAPPVARSNWFHLESVSLGNGGTAAAAFSVGSGAVPGDDVGVVVGWQWPDAKDAASGANFQAVLVAMGTKRWQNEPRSPDWVGNAVAQALRIDASSISGRKDIKTILKVWFSAGLLKVSAQLDEHRKTRQYIEIVGGY